MRFLTGVVIAAVTVRLAGPVGAMSAASDAEVERVVAQEIHKVFAPGGAAVAVRIDGRTLFFNFGLADCASKRPDHLGLAVQSASVGKVFDVTLLALVVGQGVVAFDDPVAKYIAELRQGGDIRTVTLGQLVSFTSGFDLPQDHPPWPPAYYTWRKFVRTLNNWKIDKDYQRGQQYLYSHAGFMLLHVALVILINRGKLNGRDLGHPILLRLARSESGECKVVRCETPLGEGRGDQR